MTIERTSWTDADYEHLSWHDVHVHGVALRAGAHGTGQLLLDLDFIVEWVCEPGGSCQFRVVPATLTFVEVFDLRIEIDYASVGAALVPFSIDRIDRKPSSVPGGRLHAWTIRLNWPRGTLSFGASGFSQIARGPTVLWPEQALPAATRAAFEV